MGDAADDGEVAQGFDAYLPAIDGMAQEGRTGQLGLAVHHHAATAADSHAARPAIGEGAIQLVLDVIQDIEDDPVLVRGNLVRLKTGLIVLLRRVARNLKSDRVGHFSSLA